MIRSVADAFATFGLVPATYVLAVLRNGRVQNHARSA